MSSAICVVLQVAYVLVVSEASVLADDMEWLSFLLFVFFVSVTIQSHGYNSFKHCNRIVMKYYNQHEFTKFLSSYSESYRVIRTSRYLG